MDRRPSSTVKDAANWSRYMNSMEFHVSSPSNTRAVSATLSQPVVVKSTESVGSQTPPWSPSSPPSNASVISPLGGNNLLDPLARKASGPSLARTWSWRVNRHDTRIVPQSDTDEEESAPLGWDERQVTFDTEPVIEHPDSPKSRKSSFFGKKKKSKRRQRRESLGANLRGKLGFFSLVMHDFRVWWKRYRRETWEVPVFRDAINTTESHFGSSVVSLFVFTKWIFCLNLGLALLWFGFVILPNMIFFPYTDVTHRFRLTNLLDGKGVLGDSWMFYGHYPSMINSYHLDLAYLMAILITYFGSFFIILRGIAKAQSDSEKEDHSTRHKFASLLLTGYDYSITSREAVNQSTLGIINTIHDLMVETRAHAALFMRSRSRRIKVKAFRVLAWFITIILIGGGCAGIIYLVVYINFADQLHGASNVTTDVAQSEGFFQVYGTTLVFSLINILVPLIISRLPLMEHYSTGKVELSVTLARVFCLRMANLIALLFSLYDTIQQVVDDQSAQASSTTSYGCVGTVIGQELYKLVVMDTIIHAVVNLSMYFCRFYWSMNKLELHLPSAILVIVYRQALIWVGTLACPMMPFVGLLSTSVFFGVNYLVVHRTCKPPEKRWNQSRHSAFFLRFLLFSLLLLLPPISYIVGSNDLALGKASANVPNGPFGLNQPTSAFARFRYGLPDWMKDALNYILSDVVLLPAFLLLITVVLYQRLLVSYTLRHTVYLKADLTQEREDNKNMAKRLRFLQHMELTNKASLSPGRKRR